MNGGRGSEFEKGRALGAAIRKQINAQLAERRSDAPPVLKVVSEAAPDLTGLVSAVGQIRISDYATQFARIGEELDRLALASDEQTAALRDQTNRLEAVAKLPRTVTYDAAGRVTRIDVGKAS